MKNLLFSKPTYGPSCDPAIDKNHRDAIMFASNHGVRWVGDISSDRMGWAAARNGIVEAALEASEKDPIDGIFWVDDDILLPVETIAKLASYDLDLVSGLYFQRAGKHLPLMAKFNEKIESFEWPLIFPEDRLVQVDGVGFGCVYTSIDLIRRVSALPECTNGPFGSDFAKKPYGEDFLFCLRARKLGIRPYVDTALLCQHYMGPRYSDFDLFKVTRASLLEEAKNGAVRQ